MMRLDLSHLPLQKQRELARVVAFIRDRFEAYFAKATSPKKKAGRIEQIILFGSYARGALSPSASSSSSSISSPPDLIRGSIASVRDPRVKPEDDGRETRPEDDGQAKPARAIKQGWVDEYYTVKGYRSDYDLLILVNQEELTELGGVWSFVEEDLLADQKAHPLRPDVNFIVHTSADMQSMLDKGRFFFLDIFEEGLPLYAAPEHRALIAPKSPLPEDVRRAEAKVHFEEWWPSAAGFLDTFSYVLSQGRLKEAAFQLHQATESAYHCFLLVKTNYTPRTHNIKLLRSLAESLEPRLIPVWPRATQADRKPFNKLKDAYVKARYSPQYKITREELDWLGERVKELQSLVETIRPN